MSQHSAKISEAWRLHRASDNQAAQKIFQEVISALQSVGDERENAADIIDAHYGLGLAYRADNQISQAGDAFRKSLSRARENLKLLRANTNNSNNLDTLEDDRYAMLITMISQRMTEIGLKDF